MKLTWKNQTKNKNNKRPITAIFDLPFDQEEQDSTATVATTNTDKERSLPGNDDGAQPSTAASDGEDTIKLAESFQSQGNKLAEVGKYREALGKWESAITLMPERATLHEQKAQVLLELGETWKSLMAATRATQLEPSWAEAWVTLGRAQLNFGEPDSAINSFDTALAIKPDFVEAKEDRQTALNLIKKRKQLHSSGLSDTENRYVVVEKTHEQSE